MKLKTTSPYTKERAEQLHRIYLQRNSLGLALMSAGHVALGLVYGDSLMALYFAAFVVFGIAYATLFKSLSHGYFVGIGEVLIVVGVSGSHLVLPEGAASAVLLFPLGITLMIFSQTMFRGVLIFTIGTVLFFVVSESGLFIPDQHYTPVLFSYLVTLFYSGGVLAFQLNRARTNVEHALCSLVATESELKVKEEALKRYQTTLSALNVELDTSNAVLLDTLNQESKTNSVLEEERANQEELTKAIHRDLRDPLLSIVTASEELRQRFELLPEAKPVKSYLGFAIDGANRMTSMLDDLLEYTKGNDAQEVESVDLNAVVSDLQRDLSDLLERSGATLVASELPVIQGFSTQLLQLFQNLLSNALKFSRPGVPPKVSIFSAEIQDNPDRFMVRVRDNGVGIPANQIDSIFGLFNRAHSEEGYEGSGVGLALCRRIAVAHDAELTVASIPGEGSQFTISFPTSSIVEYPNHSPIVNISSSRKTVQNESV
ncbi:MAG: ATP-binding protein [Saprospiraceae bacterium]